MEENNDLVESLKNIDYQSKKLVLLSNTFDHSMKVAINLFSNRLSDEDFLIDQDEYFKAQVDADALLNAYASLIDYYYIFIAIKMNVPEHLINKVQYKKIANNLVTKGMSWSDFISDLKSVIVGKFGQKYNLWDEYYYIWAEVFKKELVFWGVFDRNIKPYTEEKTKDGKVFITPHPLIQEYYSLTNFLHCYRNGDGHKYNIFLELNNFLKHNRYPLLQYELHVLGGNTYAYAFYTIKKSDYKMLKDGILKIFAEIDFNVLKSALEHLSKDTGTFSELEMELGMPILTIDKSNGYEYQGALYFYLSDVLISRKSDSISINSRDLFSVSGRLVREIEKAVDIKILS